jgi:hypothetical protein
MNRPEGASVEGAKSLYYLEGRDLCIQKINIYQNKDKKNIQCNLKRNKINCGLSKNIMSKKNHSMSGYSLSKTILFDVSFTKIG